MRDIKNIIELAKQISKAAIMYSSILDKRLT